MKLISFINFCIVSFTNKIGNYIELLKAKIKLQILAWKVARHKISKDEHVNLCQALVNEYSKWQIKSIERIDLATRNLKNSFKGEWL